MKKIIGVALILVVVLFALPFVVRQAQDTGQDPQPTAQEEAALPDSGHTLRVKGSDGQVTEMDLNQYLWGVVAAEMPASFSQEALKAQAVAARTYALNKGPSSNHPDADLCTDYACCQAWIARDKAQGNWGDKAAEYTNKITTAVAETGNQGHSLPGAAHRRGLPLLLQRGHPGRGGGLGQQRALSPECGLPRGGGRAQL